MKKLYTERLELIPCSYEIGKIIVENKSLLKSGMGLDISGNWPLEDLKGFLPVYLEMLQSDPSLLGWGIWLIMDIGEQKIIGDIGFKGKPDGYGNIEIGYSVVPEYRKQGYCYEASNGLVDWAFKQLRVNKVLAECDKDNVPSIRILEKLHMQLKDRNKQMFKWELTKTSWEERHFA